jgi:hypothetical protein
MALIIDSLDVYANCGSADIRHALVAAATACPADVEWRASAYDGPEIPVGMTEITLRGPAVETRSLGWQESSPGVYRRLVACASREWPFELSRAVRAMIEQA